MEGLNDDFGFWGDPDLWHNFEDLATAGCFDRFGDDYDATLAFPSSSLQGTSSMAGLHWTGLEPELYVLVSVSQQRAEPHLRDIEP